MNVTLTVSPSSALRTGPGQMQNTVTVSISVLRDV